MKTTLLLVLCLIFSMSLSSQALDLKNKHRYRTQAYTYTSNNRHKAPVQTNSGNNNISTLHCKGNGMVTFINSSPQPLWFYYWYPEDVANASKECRFRRFWKQLDAGSNVFSIAKNKTLIFRICTGTECTSGAIKQFGIVHYCDVSNGIINVK